METKFGRMPCSRVEPGRTLTAALLTAVEAPRTSMFRGGASCSFPLSVTVPCFPSEGPCSPVTNTRAPVSVWMALMRAPRSRALPSFPWHRVNL
jgi:hypothetical protein